MPSFSGCREVEGKAVPCGCADAQKLEEALAAIAAWEEELAKAEAKAKEEVAKAEAKAKEEVARVEEEAKAREEVMTRRLTRLNSINVILQCAYGSCTIPAARGASVAEDCVLPPGFDRDTALRRFREKQELNNRTGEERTQHTYLNIFEAFFEGVSSAADEYPTVWDTSHSRFVGGSLQPDLVVCDNMTISVPVLEVTVGVVELKTLDNTAGAKQQLVERAWQLYQLREREYENVALYGLVGNDELVSLYEVSLCFLPKEGERVVTLTLLKECSLDLSSSSKSVWGVLHRFLTLAKQRQEGRFVSDRPDGEVRYCIYRPPQSLAPNGKASVYLSYIGGKSCVLKIYPDGQSGQDRFQVEKDALEKMKGRVPSDTNLAELLTQFTVDSDEPRTVRCDLVGQAPRLHTAEQVDRFVSQLEGYLSTLHASHFIHGDISPGNIIQVCSDAAGGATTTPSSSSAESSHLRRRSTEGACDVDYHLIDWGEAEDTEGDDVRQRQITVAFTMSIPLGADISSLSLEMKMKRDMFSLYATAVFLYLQSKSELNLRWGADAIPMPTDVWAARKIELERCLHDTHESNAIKKYVEIALELEFSFLEVFRGDQGGTRGDRSKRVREESTTPSKR